MVFVWTWRAELSQLASTSSGGWCVDFLEKASRKDKEKLKWKSVFLFIDYVAKIDNTEPRVQLKNKKRVI